MCRRKLKQKEKVGQKGKSCPKHFILRGSRPNAQAKPSAPPVLMHHINRKPKPKVFMATLQNPMLGIQVQVRISSTIHQIPVEPNLVLCLPSCMVWSWTLAKENRGDFTSTIIQQGQTRFRFETKAKTGHLEAVRKLFQILNRPGGLCTSP